MRQSFARVAAFAWLLCGCLPLVEDPPLTATGEAPVGWAPGKISPVGGGADATSSGKVTTATVCSGVYSGNLPPSTPSGLTTSPCTVTGVVHVASLSPAHLGQLAKTTSIGSLSIGSQGDFSKLPALRTVATLTAIGVADAVFAAPATLDVTHSISISGTMTSIAGFVGVKNLAGTLQLVNLPKVKTISGFNNLGTVASMTISGSPALAQISGFESLTVAQNLAFADFKMITTGTSTSGIAFKPLNIVTIGLLTLSNCQGWGTINVFQKATKIQKLQMTAMQGTSNLIFNNLTQVESLFLTEIQDLHSLDGLGANLQVTSGVVLCDIGMSAAEREAWRLKHAPNLQFALCATGCKGEGSCP